MSIIDDLRKVLQDFLAPEIRTINARLDGINSRLDAINEKMDYRFKAFEEKMDLRFDAVMKELATDRRIERLERLADTTASKVKEETN
jgi:hypothetical protein